MAYFGFTVASVGRGVFLLTLSPALHFVSVSGRLRDEASKAVIQSEVLRISPSSSSFSNYPVRGILVVLDNNGSAGVRLSPLKCGWRKPTSMEGQRNVCFCRYVIEREANLFCSLLAVKVETICVFPFFSWFGCDNETCSLEVIMCSSIIMKCHMFDFDKQIC